MFTDANKYNLIDALAQGKKVIVSVDSGELWHKDSEIFEDLFKGERADHALVVCGIDTSDSTVAVVKLFGEAYDVRLLFSDISLYQNDLKHKFKKLKRELMGNIRLYYRDDTGQFYETTISRVTTVADENEKLKILQKYW